MRVDYVRATKGAKQLLKKLDGEGWQTTVWEKAGWHFKAESGPLAVFGDYFGKNGAARYACTVLGHKPDNFVSGDPNEAVAHTLDHYLAVASRSLEILFDACAVSHSTILKHHEFFRVFSQHPAVEPLRHPGGRSIDNCGGRS